MVKWQATLSTTEPYNYIGIQNVRQGNRNTEVLEAILVENALPLDLTGCEVFFESVIDNKYPIQRAAKIVNAKKGLSSIPLMNILCSHCIDRKHTSVFIKATI